MKPGRPKEPPVETMQEAHIRSLLNKRHKSLTEAVQSVTATSNSVRVGDSWVSDREKHDEKLMELFTKYYDHALSIVLNRFLQDVQFNLDVPHEEKAKPPLLMAYVSQLAEASVSEWLRYEDKVKGLAMLAEADLGEDVK
jgi:hypothetical protein